MILIVDRVLKSLDYGFPVEPMQPANHNAPIEDFSLPIGVNSTP